MNISFVGVRGLHTFLFVFKKRFTKVLLVSRIDKLLVLSAVKCCPMLTCIFSDNVWVACVGQGPFPVSNLEGKPSSGSISLAVWMQTKMCLMHQHQIIALVLLIE